MATVMLLPDFFRGRMLFILAVERGTASTASTSGRMSASFTTGTSNCSPMQTSTSSSVT